MNIRPSANNQRIYFKIKSIEHNVKRGIRQGYYNLGKQLKKYLSDKMLEKPKHGRVYLIKRGSRYVKHTASAPWEYAANMTGKLRRSIDFKVHGYQQLEFGQKMPYAKYIERGTSKMEPRKNLRAAIKDNLGNARMYFEQEIKKKLNQD
jgi:HK97 gp10 family phage protein